MGFLKKLFEKKDCEICGGEIGLLGNKKLVDGDMCKNCAAKLSPWFTDRKQSTVAEIKEQLAYREANAAQLRSGFRPTLTLGDYYKMHVMFQNGVPYSFVVSSADNFVEANADIIRFTDVISCNVDIRDSRTELKRETESGEEVSYNPPRYEFSYDFYIELCVNNPYFDSIRFELNRNTVELISELQTNRSFRRAGQFLSSSNDFDPTYSPEFRQYQMMCDEIAEIVRQGQNPGTVSDIPQKQEEPAAADPMQQEEPATVPNESVSEEDTEKAAADTSAAEKEESPKLGDPGICPDCGATDQTGAFCEYCGAKL